MGIKLRTIVDDISVDLNQVFDDKTIQDSQIAYWVTIVANRLKSQHVGKRDSGAFLTVFSDVPLVVSDSSKKDSFSVRKSFDLPRCIYDYEKDGAIEYISYHIENFQEGCPPPFTNVQFARTSPSKSRMLYFNAYDSPSPSNPFFYRVGDTIFTLGLECVNVDSIEIGIYTSIDPVEKIDIDADFEFPEELIVILKRQVLDIGRFALLIPEEKTNDGSDGLNTNGIPTGKIASVNDLSDDQLNNK